MCKDAQVPRAHGKDCSYNPLAFPPSVEVRCAKAAFALQVLASTLCVSAPADRLHPRGVRSWPSMLGLDALRQPSLTQLSYRRELLFRLEFRMLCWCGLYTFGFNKVSAGVLPDFVRHPCSPHRLTECLHVLDRGEDCRCKDRAAAGASRLPRCWPYADALADTSLRRLASCAGAVPQKPELNEFLLCALLDTLVLP